MKITNRQWHNNIKCIVVIKLNKKYNFRVECMKTSDETLLFVFNKLLNKIIV